MIGHMIARLFAPDPVKAEARRRAALPAVPARVHDYRGGRRGWGHDIALEAVAGAPGDFRGYMFAGRADLGDHVLWSAPYGHAVARIVEERRPTAPRDMHYVTLEIIRRHGHDGEILT